MIGSLAFGDLITLSSTSSLTMVFNSILATKILKEVFTREDLISVALIGVGASMCVVFSNYKSKQLTQDVNSVVFSNIGTSRSLYLSTKHYILHIDCFVCCIRL